MDPIRFYVRAMRDSNGRDIGRYAVYDTHANPPAIVYSSPLWSLCENYADSAYEAWVNSNDPR
jgi:hypothetical protein